VTEVANNGNGGTPATVTLPTGTEGQVLYVATADPQGLTVAGFAVTIAPNEFGHFMFINGAWRIAH